MARNVRTQKQPHVGRGLGRWFILLGLLVSSSLHAQPLPGDAAAAEAGPAEVRLANVDAAYVPYVAPVGDAAAAVGEAVPGLVEVPVYGRNSGDSRGLVLAVDYDQTFLRFEAFRKVSDAWNREQVSKDNPNGRAKITFTRYSRRGVVDEDVEFLIGYVQFALNEVDVTELPASPHAIDVLLQGSAERSSYYYETDLDGNEVRLDTDLSDGKISLFFKDGAFLGSGVVSPVQQDFSLPLHLTVLKPDGPVVLTVDYDQTFLRFRGAGLVPGIIPAGGIVELEPETVEGAAGATVLSLTLNPQDFDGPLLREHVADLTFNYTGRDPDEGHVNVSVKLVSPDAPSESQEKGAREWLVAQIEIGSPYFVRGNVSSEYGVSSNGTRIYSKTGLVDVQLIFQFLMAGGDLPCHVAADVDASGGVQLTDAVMLLGYLYGSGSLPSAPFPEAGWLEDYEVELGCEKSLPYYLLKQ